MPVIWVVQLQRQFQENQLISTAYSKTNNEKWHQTPSLDNLKKIFLNKNIQLIQITFLPVIRTVPSHVGLSIMLTVMLWPGGIETSRLWQWSWASPSYIGSMSVTWRCWVWSGLKSSMRADDVEFTHHLNSVIYFEN